MESYLKREKEGGRFSFDTILSEELGLDRDEEGGSVGKRRGGSS